MMMHAATIKPGGCWVGLLVGCGFGLSEGYGGSAFRIAHSTPFPLRLNAAYHSTSSLLLDVTAEC